MLVNIFHLMCAEVNGALESTQKSMQHQKAHYCAQLANAKSEQAKNKILDSRFLHGYLNLLMTQKDDAKIKDQTFNKFAAKTIL